MIKKDQIEEMAIGLEEEFVLCGTLSSCGTKRCSRCFSKYLYEQGYRKLSEDSVVLSREEYEKLKQYEEKVENGACFTQKEWLELCDEEYRRETENLLKVRQLERKETAREILNELIDSSNKITFFDCRMALGLDKLAKQYGLEIKE